MICVQRIGGAGRPEAESGGGATGADDGAAHPPAGYPRSTPGAAPAALRPHHSHPPSVFSQTK